LVTNEETDYNKYLYDGSALSIAQTLRETFANPLTTTELFDYGTYEAHKAVFYLLS